MEQKYVVFKKEDFDYAMGAVMHFPAEQVKDCFVIRFQDVLAGPGLHAYANAAQTFLEGMIVGHDNSPPGEGATHEMRRSIERLRDAAFEAANIADNYPNKKVPD